MSIARPSIYKNPPNKLIRGRSSNSHGATALGSNSASEPKIEATPMDPLSRVTMFLA